MINSLYCMQQAQYPYPQNLLGRSIIICFIVKSSNNSHVIYTVQYLSLWCLPTKRNHCEFNHNNLNCTDITERMTLMQNMYKLIKHPDHMIDSPYYTLSYLEHSLSDLRLEIERLLRMRDLLVQETLTVKRDLLIIIGHQNSS